MLYRPSEPSAWLNADLRTLFHLAAHPHSQIGMTDLSWGTWAELVEFDRGTHDIGIISSAII